MINKVYEKIKQFIKENYLSFLFYLVFIATMIYPLPYYIYTGGGTINVEDKIKVEEANTTSGSFNMCYVEQINATIPTYLLSKVFNSWDLVSKEEVTLNQEEDIQDIYKRDKIYLDEANQNAILVAYRKASKKVNIKDTHQYVIYIDENSKTNLKIGDDIVEISGNKIKNIEDVIGILEKYNVGDKLLVKVRNNKKIIDKYATVIEKDGKKMIGIAITTIYDYSTDPEIEFSFSNTESGPSGGLMVTLAIYNKLVDVDISKGLKIAGTGTIDSNGMVGSVGGIKYKLKGAVSEKADIFLVPNGENYEESIMLQKKYNYDIKIIGVDSFDDALTELKKINK